MAYRAYRRQLQLVQHHRPHGARFVLKDPTQECDETKEAIIAFCRAQLIKWSCPREIEFRRELPKTRVGKVDFRALMEEHGR